MERLPRSTDTGSLWADSRCFEHYIPPSPTLSVGEATEQHYTMNGRFLHHGNEQSTPDWRFGMPSGINVCLQLSIRSCLLLLALCVLLVVPGCSNTPVEPGPQTGGSSSILFTRVTDTILDGDTIH